MRKCLFYLIFSLLLFVGIANAEVVSGLNVATVPVTNASTVARQAALPKALGRVLIKLSGNPMVMTIPAIQNAVDDMNSYIQSYGYLNQDRSDGQSQLELQVAFDQKALKELLRLASQADWASNRPLTLLWIKILNAGDDTFVLSNTNAPTLSRVVLSTAKSRGIPVLLPAMDLQDQNFINPISGPFDKILLKEASQRYGAAAVLAGNVVRNGNKWEGTWLLLMNDTPYQWRNKADSTDALLKKSLNDMVNLMANQLAVANTKDLQTQVTLGVSNVQTLRDYTKVLSIVRRLTPVANVTIKDMNNSDLILQVSIAGGEQALSDALALEQRFEVLATSEDTKRSADLFYRWQGEQVRG